MRQSGPTYYGDYLQLETFLNTQNPKSKEYGAECHDEMLFIIVHQAFELWFKQIIHEFRSALTTMSGEFVRDEEFSKVVDRFERIKKIQPLMFNHLDILETMTPMDFLEFRDLLIPASGFQSVQFREIEIRMGLNTKDRTEVDRDFFIGRLSPKDRHYIDQVESEKSMFELLNQWLERMPFSNKAGFNFWNEYQKAVEELLTQEEKIISSNQASLSDKNKLIQLENFKNTKETFSSLLNVEKHQELMREKKRRLSHQATLNALFILLYRDEPLFQLPYKLLASLMDIDENFTTWRYRHALMAQRMLGTKIGTGGSSGHVYLKKAADNNRIYVDLFNLSTFIIPRSSLPKLPKELKRELNFYFSENYV